MSDVAPPHPSGDWRLLLSKLKSRIGHFAGQHPAEAVPDCMALLDQFRVLLLDDAALRRSANEPLPALSKLGHLVGLPDGPQVVGGWQSGDLVVLFVDLEAIQPIYVAHGQDAGDAVLRIVAARLARALGTDSVSGGISAHDFATLIAGLSHRESLASLACKLFDLVAAPLAIGRLNLRLRPSIGIAVSPANSAGAHASLRCSTSASQRIQHA